MGVSSRFRLLGRISRGGMAEVLLAEEQRQDGVSHLVAVKRVLPHDEERDQLKRMLHKEARLMGLLRHPNIVHVEGLEVLDGESYLVMEAVDGLTCAELLERTPRLPLPIAARILVDAAAGLERAHTLRTPEGSPMPIVHRDVAPDNVLIAWDGSVKVSDFGIALSLNAPRTTEQGVIKGKLAYMSPEQVGGREIDARSDIYSLGAVAYQLVNGERPFMGGTDGETIATILTQPPAPLPEDTPEPLAHLLLASLSKDPRARPASARDFSAALQQVVRPASQQALAQFIEEQVPPKDPLRRRFERARRQRPSTQVMSDRTVSLRVQSHPHRFGYLGGRRWVAIALASVVAAAAWTLKGLPSRSRVPPPAPHPTSASPAPEAPAAPATRQEPKHALVHHPKAGVLRRAKSVASVVPHPTAAQGALEVLSDVPCEVSVDGVDAGMALSVAPAVRGGLTQGVHRVRCRSAQAGLDLERAVTVGPGAPTQMHFSPARATLRVRVAPWGRARVDGNDLGPTPVPPLGTYEGHHHIEGEQGGRRQSKEVDLKPGEDRLVVITLEGPE